MLEVAPWLILLLGSHPLEVNQIWAPSEATGEVSVKNRAVGLIPQPCAAPAEHGTHPRQRPSDFT